MLTAHDKIIALMVEHGLGFLFNPGGGQFTCRDSSYPLYGFNCQVDAWGDEEADLKRLEKGIAEALAKIEAKT